MGEEVITPWQRFHRDTECLELMTRITEERLFQGIQEVIEARRYKGRIKLGPVLAKAIYIRRNRDR